jgi:hypothetical protein
MTSRPSAVELLTQGTGLLDSGHFRELGLSERATQAVWRAVRVVYLPASTDRSSVSRTISRCSPGTPTATDATPAFGPRGETGGGRESY